MISGSSSIIHLNATTINVKASTLHVGSNQPYKTIQGAIDAAEVGDTIYVLNGTYYEHRTITKSITLIGAGHDNTTIICNGTGNVITITASGVNISNFTLTGDGSNWNNAGIEVICSNNCSITNCRFKENFRRGLFLNNSYNTTIVKNSFSNNIEAIFINISSSNMILDNTFSNNIDGIVLSYSGNNTIKNNNFTSNWDYSIFLAGSNNNNIINNFIFSQYGCGIYLINSNDNTITKNNALADNYGIYLESSDYNNITYNNASGRYGIRLITSNNNCIANNNASNNNEGFYISSSNNNTISHNNASYNNKGFYIYSSNDNIISNNKAYSNNWWGIHLFNSSGNTIVNNSEVSNNFGIQLYLSNNNIIIDNLITNNWENIHIVLSRNITIFNNKISSNFDSGIYLDSSKEVKLENNAMVNNSLSIEGALLEHWNTHTIDATNTVNGKPIYYWSNRTNGTVPRGANQVILANCSNVIIEGQNVSNCSVGIMLGFSNKNKVMNNIVSNGSIGIILSYSNNNTISSNTILSNSYYGLQMGHSDNNIILNNNISLNELCGISIESSTGNIFDNNFISNSYTGIIMSNSNDQILTNNKIVLNYGLGIYLAFSKNITLTSNQLTNDEIFLEGTSLEHWITHGIDISNMINGKPIYYWKNRIGGSIPNGAGQIILANCTNMLIEHQNIINVSTGIQLGFSNSNTISNNKLNLNMKYGIHIYSSHKNIIENNNISGNGVGIRLQTSSTQTIVNNTIMNNGKGITLYLSSNNFITNNTIKSNTNEGIDLRYSNTNSITYNSILHNREGISIQSSNDNIIYNNTFLYNNANIQIGYQSNSNVIFHNNFFSVISTRIFDWTGKSQWDNGYPIGGNYWSDYRGEDLFKGPDQDIPGSDGFGDTPYGNIGGEIGSQDNYPLLSPVEITISSLLFPPTAPLNLTAFVGDGFILLTWSAPTFDGGSPITSYNIYRWSGIENNTLLATVDGNVLRYNDLNLTHGKLHRYWVSAENSAGKGPNSTGTTGTPIEYPKVNTDSDSFGKLSQLRCALFGIILIFIIGVVIVKLILRRKYKKTYKYLTFGVYISR